MKNQNIYKHMSDIRIKIKEEVLKFRQEILLTAISSGVTTLYLLYETHKRKVLNSSPTRCSTSTSRKPLYKFKRFYIHVNQ